MYFNKEHKERVENRGDDYIYIGSYHRNEETIDGKKSKSHIRVKCPYCGKEYDVRLSQFSGKRKVKCANCCNTYKNSFAYYIQVELGEGLNKYWDWEKNDLNPYMIYKSSKKKVYMKCIKNNQHGSYKTTCDNFHFGRRCPYCSTHNDKVHPKDSFGALYPEKAKYWSPNNKKSPFEVTPKSSKKYKFICEKCGKEFERVLSDMNQNDTGVVCRRCQGSKLEIKTKHILDKYNVKYEREKTFDNLYGLKKGLLRFDFYLSDYNLLIECQGEQHESWQETWMTKGKFERQLEHDKRKRKYALENNISLLEIWYYDIDNIEDILINELNLK